MIKVSNVGQFTHRVQHCSHSQSRFNCYTTSYISIISKSGRNCQPSSNHVSPFLLCFLAVCNHSSNHPEPNPSNIFNYPEPQCISIMYLSLSLHSKQWHDPISMSHPLKVCMHQENASRDVTFQNYWQIKVRYGAPREK